MTTKIIWIILIGSLCVGLTAIQPLNMYISTTRFLDDDKNTVLFIDYQIPYRNISFVAKQSAFFADVAILLEVVHRDSVIGSYDYLDSIGLSNKHDTTSPTKSHLNRIKLLLDEDDYLLRFTAVDMNTDKVFRQVFEPKLLNHEPLVSDIELVSLVRTDTTRYLEKFHRSGILFQPEPSQIFSKDDADHFYLYFEIYETSNTGKDLYNIDLRISQGDSTFVSKNFDYLPNRSSEGISLKVPIDDLKQGLYYGDLIVTYDQFRERRNFKFAISESRETFVFLFPDEEEEFQLIRYFLSSGQVSDWRIMTPQAKRRFISQFWSNLALATNQTVDQALNMIRERVDHSNRFFTHFHPGWTTDMGRIFIRNGAPDEIEKGQTSDETRYVRKDYQIWRYTLRRKAVYLFVDIHMSGNYRLMYVSNDEMEFSNPDWKRFLGEDFDEAKLR